MKTNHIVGGVLLVAGTTIGAGMLALPVVTAFMGLIPSLCLFVFCWIFMLLSALFLVDVNCHTPKESNLITMAEKTIGPFGKIVSWVFYLLLLYALIAAYIAASSPLFISAFSYFTNGKTLAPWMANFCLPVLFGSFIYLGTFGVDIINRFLMAALVTAYVLLVIFLPSHLDSSLLQRVDFSTFMTAMPAVLTAFGYHIIIPTLATYLNHSKKHLVLTVVLGSLIALVINIVWQILVLGVVPLYGEYSLNASWTQGESAVFPLSMIVKNPMIGIGAYFFSFFAIITSFLGVALSLSDFLCDGLKIKKTWEGRLIALLLTFLPPIVFVFTYPRGFIAALEYAGAFVAILLVFIPSAMAWKIYRSVLAKMLLLLVMLFSFVVVGVNVWLQFSS
ncbi:MAG: tyrosine transporter [Chlamydiae bacterium]|nr:tyrosine transporter [Chlamydiota bacterium]